MRKTSISLMPTDGISYDPSEIIYWDKDLLENESNRVFEVCNSCRLCFKFCESFPKLFDYIDNRHSGDVSQLNVRERNSIMNSCFQCKLCEILCPYSPRDNHQFNIDFPNLVHRYKAIQFKKIGSNLRDKILTNSDLIGLLSRLSLGVINIINKSKFFRLILEWILGIHRNKSLPSFSFRSFESMAKKSGKMNQKKSTEVILFQSCYVQNNDPILGMDTIEVFEQNQIDISCVKGLLCCGMPSWECGDLRTLREKALRNINYLLPYVEEGAKVVVINPTCAMMMKNEYPTLLENIDRQNAKIISEAIYDPSEYLWSIRNEKRFNTDFKSIPSKDIGYHASCHIRARGIGLKGRDLLELIPGVETNITLECCGHDGTYAMKKEHYESSISVGQKAFTGLQNSNTSLWATDCPLASLQIEEHAGQKPLHPMTILAKAYRYDGFTQEKLHKDNI